MEKTTMSVQELSAHMGSSLLKACELVKTPGFPTIRVGTRILISMEVYCKYYKVMYILFHTGMRILEFCGLTLKDIDLENRTVNIDHQLQRTCDMRYIIEETKTEVGKRKIPITEDVAQMFHAIIEDREPPKMFKVV